MKFYWLINFNRAGGTAVYQMMVDSGVRFYEYAKEIAHQQAR